MTNTTRIPTCIRAAAGVEYELFAPLIGAAARLSARHARCRSEDVLGTVYITLRKCLDGFDPSRDAGFEAYFFRAAVSEALSKFVSRDSQRNANRFRPKVKGRHPCEPFDIRAHETATVPDTPQVERVECLMRFWDLVVGAVSEREVEVLKALYQEGVTLAEVGKRFGVSRQWVFQVEEKAIRKLKLGLPESVYDLVG